MADFIWCLMTSEKTYLWDLSEAFYGHDPIEQMIERLHGMVSFIGKDGFLSYLAYTAALGRAVKNPELMALDMLGETELAKSYRKKKSV